MELKQSKSWMLLSGPMQARTTGTGNLSKAVNLISMAHLAKRISDLKQNGTQERHHFLAQFSIPFHMVCSDLLRVLASKTIE